jgi:hypothetical protein
MLLAPHWTGFDLPGRALSHAEAFGYARACWPSGSDEEVEFLALQIAVMTALDDAFDALDANQHPSPLPWLIPWLDSADPTGNESNDPTNWAPQWAEMRAALAALDARIQVLVRGDARRREAVRAWWRRQAEHQVAAFYREAQWRSQRMTPDLSVYLAVAQRSIGVEWTAATLIAFDDWTAVPSPGSPLRITVDGIARAIRLANDLHDPERERQEGKPQWLLMRAHELVQHGSSAAAAERQAARELRSAVISEVAQARAMLAGRASDSPRLNAALSRLLQIGLAAYTPDLTATT